MVPLLRWPFTSISSLFPNCLYVSFLSYLFINADFCLLLYLFFLYLLLLSNCCAPLSVVFDEMGSYTHLANKQTNIYFIAAEVLAQTARHILKNLDQNPNLRKCGRHFPGMSRPKNGSISKSFDL